MSDDLDLKINNGKTPELKFAEPDNIQLKESAGESPAVSPPAVSSSSVSVSVSTPTMKPDASDEVVLEYRPFSGTEKWFAYRFSAWNSSKAWFTILLVVVFFGFGGPGFVVRNLVDYLNHLSGVTGTGTDASGASYSNGFLVLCIFFGLIGIVYALLSLIYLAQPTHVRLDRKRLALEWARGGKSKTKELLWSDVERVDLYWPPGKTSPQDCQIKFSSRKGSAQSVSLKLGAIVKGTDRNRLLNAIEQWAPDIHKDVKLIEVLSPAQDHSYTELWLQALSAPPKRERLTPLSENSSLFDGRYKVIRQLGVGGQGTAYLSSDTVERSEVVLKEFILPVYVDTNVLRQALERMQNEAAILRKLDNPRIVRLNDFFVEDHRGYLVLEKIDGESLEQLVSREGALSEARVRELALQMCEILGYLHSLEPAVIHRDFTPDNLILSKDGTLKLVDFNVAQQTESTATGTVVGKHSYIAPEQFRGKPTPQSDIYAMGATLYYLLTAEAPEPIKVSRPKKKRPDVSAHLDDVIANATAFDASKRYAQIELLLADLNSELVSKPD